MGRSASGSSSNSRSRSSERGRAKKDKRQKKDKKDRRDRRRRDRAPGEATTDSEDGQQRRSSSALALPENVTTVDAELINSLCRSVNEMTTAVAKMSKGMDKVTEELRSQKAQVQTVVSQLQQLHLDTTKKMTKFEDDMTTMNTDIDAKLAEMGKLLAAPPTYASTVASASSSDAVATTLAAKPPASQGGAHRPTRIWLKGFRETLTTKFLNNYASTVITKLPAHLRTNARSGAPGFGAVAYIDFPSGTPMGQVKTAIHEMNLTHTDDLNETHKIRTAPDVPLAVRHRGRVLGELWKLVQPHLDLQADCVGYKLGNSNGRLFIVLGDRPTELFSSSVDDSGLHVTPHEKNLEKYKITADQAAAWITSASKSAFRAGQ
jgi:hypothetical protein